MKTSDIIEMEWLAASLLSTSARLTRAVALLRAAGDLERLQAKLAAISTAPPPPASATAPPGHRPAANAVAPLRSPAVSAAPAGDRQPRVASGSSAERGSSSFAVFDGADLARVEMAKISAGKPRGSARVPF